MRGVFCESANLTLKDCLLLNNHGEASGAAVSSFGSNLIIDGCTIYGNTSADSSALGNGAIGVVGWEFLGIHNTIVAFNASAAISCSFDGGIDITCSNFFGNELGDWVECIEGHYNINGNFTSDPMFCNAQGGNFAVNESSQCAPLNNSCGILVGTGSVGCSGCCVYRGNIDGNIVSGVPIDISDMVALVDYMFTGGIAPECWSEANVDGLGPDDASGIDMPDLVYLVDYMMTGGPPPPACP